MAQTTNMKISSSISTFNDNEFNMSHTITITVRVHQRK